MVEDGGGEWKDQRKKPSLKKNCQFGLLRGKKVMPRASVMTHPRNKKVLPGSWSISPEACQKKTAEG